jgi:hypothetical protein
VISRPRTRLAVLEVIPTACSAPVAKLSKRTRNQRPLTPKIVRLSLGPIFIPLIIPPAFPARTHDEMSTHGLEYAELMKKAYDDAKGQDLSHEEACKKAEAAADRFVKEHAARYSELSRLPYFNLCRMIVIDPMHCVLLGTC